MNLAQAIHQRWAADEALSSLLPASRVYTGLSVDPSRPYAVISKQSHQPLACFHDGSTVDRVAVRVQVFHDNHDAGADIADQIKAAFHLAEFALAGNDKVTGIQRSNDFEHQNDDGVWQFVVEFTCNVYLTWGV